MFLAALSHLIADLPQPPGVWQGIPIFFPLKINNQYLRNGGWSLIGWYDLKITLYLFYAFFMSLFFVTINYLINTDEFRYTQNKKFIVLNRIIIVILLGINIFVNIWIVRYIKENPYQHGDWTDYQKKIISEIPEPLQIIFINGKGFMLKIFKKVTN